jgi:lactate permease
MNIYNILSLLPFLIIIYYLIIKGKQASKVMFGTYIFTSILLLSIWKMEIQAFLGASIRGVGVALEIFLIILSILLLFNLLKTTGKLDILKIFMKNYTSDKNILIILVGFFLVSFFESIAGFGTPAAIAVPILVFLGITPLSAILVCLTADSIAVAFGAFGVPVVYGIKESVENANLILITQYTGLILGIISILIPTLLIIIYNYSEHKSIKNISKYFPLSFFAGLSFAIPYVLASFYLNPEIISAVASITGFTITLIYLHFTNFIKHKSSNHSNISKYSNKSDKLNNSNNPNTFNLIKSFAAYFFVVLLLVASRANWFEFGSILKNIGFNLALYTTKISFPFNLYSPGILILLVFLSFSIYYKLSLNKFKLILSTSITNGKSALYTLLPTLTLVQIFIYSDINSSNLESIPFLVAELFSKTGYFYIFLAPLIGAFGAFISGSATVSNLIFGSLQSNVSNLGIYSQSLLLSLQTIGATAGNMIAIHNIVAACSLVGLKNFESTIIKHNIKIVFIYCILASILGIIIHLFS